MSSTSAASGSARSSDTPTVARWTTPNGPRAAARSPWPRRLERVCATRLDRASADYKGIYNQRTATERINGQATELGIERPRLRNEAAIANHNTLLYVLIDLRALKRVRARQAERQAA